MLTGGSSTRLDQEDAREAICPLCRTASEREATRWAGYRLMACSNCGLVFADPLMAPEQLYEYAYEPGGVYKDYLEDAKKIGERSFHLAWAQRGFLRKIKPRGKLLDVGCSTGAFLVAAKDKGWDPIGVEVSQEAARIARQETGAKVYEGSWNEARFEEQFDAITAWEVLEHSSDPVAFAQKMYDLLRPGGLFALSTPNWLSPWERRTRFPERRPPYHLTFWSRVPLRRLLATVGFRVTDIAEKPFAWNEEVGKARWFFLPVALFLSFALGIKGIHVYALAQKAEIPG